jgi:hypothetical protein
VKRHQDDDFALLGINTGDAEKLFRESRESLGVTWPCTWQGTGANPIANLYQVSGYPTIVVLDREGVIRKWGVRGEGIEAVVAELLAEGQK